MKYCGMTRPSDQNDRVCHLHFDKSSFGNSVSPNQRKQLRLRPNAMPELHIPNIPVPGMYLCILYYFEQKSSTSVDGVKHF